MLNKLDLKLEKKVINKYIRMPKLFDDLGIDYRVESNFLCPFHENLNTPSAKMYKDEEGYCLWCFSEGKMYKSWNAYKKFTRVNTNQLALYIVNHMSEDDRNNILEESDIEFEPEKLPYEDELKMFKQSKINITELLQYIKNYYINEHNNKLEGGI